MKRMGLFLLIGMLLLTVGAYAQQANDANAAGGDAEGNAGKILIAYFSSAGNIATDEPARGNVGLGNTKTIAETIQKQVGGDLFFIETANKYPANYNDTISVAMQELRGNARPELATHVENFDDYDVIFIGHPIWWGTFPQAILTFIEEYDFSGKTVIPFCTYEDSGLGLSTQDFEKALPDSTLLKSFSVRQASINDSSSSRAYDNARYPHKMAGAARRGLFRRYAARRAPRLPWAARAFSWASQLSTLWRQALHPWPAAHLRALRLVVLPPYPPSGHPGPLASQLRRLPMPPSCTALPALPPSPPAYQPA